MKIRKGSNINCLACRKKFYVPLYRIKTAKFCSVECQNHKQHEKFIFECLSCNKRVAAPPSRRNQKKKFCSLECREAKRRTDKEKRQQSKALNTIARGNNQGRTFRTHFFRVKEKKCQVCGYSEHDFCLDLHHIDGDCNNNTIENIAVLCVICHRNLHKRLINLEKK